MARTKRRSARRGFFAKRSRSRSRRSGSGNPMAMIIPAMAYGAVREKISTALTPLTSKIPLGNIADEVVLGLAAYLVAKKTSGLLSQVGKAALVIEAARIGEAAISGALGGMASSSTGVTMIG